MQGETTLDQRVNENLQRLERVRKFYALTYNNISSEDLVSQLIADAVYLSIYYGMDFENISKEMKEIVSKRYPDIC